ncbi:iron-siderophore ABC transporter substrate-binding protein [Bacillus horti]|nr:iron-siderophore ABC transporter substrate-binding protein [Bacillus horti]
MSNRAGSTGMPPEGAEGTEEAERTEGTVNERTVSHLFGETVVIGEPERIAVLHPWIADYLLSLGIVPSAAVSAGPNNDQFSWYLDDHMQGTMNLGWQIPEANLELILESDPDLIIASQNQETVYDQLTQIAPTVSIAPVVDEDGIRRMRDTFQTLARMLDKEQEAEALIEKYNNQVVELEQQVSQVIGDESVMFLRLMEKELRYYGPSLFEVLYEDLGMTPPSHFPDTSSSFEVLSIEMLPEVNPDHIFLLVEHEEAHSSIQELSIWKQLNAVQNNQVYRVDYDLWFQGFGPIANELTLQDIYEKLIENN